MSLEVIYCRLTDSGSTPNPLAILTRPNVSFYLSLLFLSLFLLPFFAPFSHRLHFFFDPEPSRHYFTSVFSPFIVLMRSLCRHAVYLTDAFLFFPVFLFCLCILFNLVILPQESSVHFTFIPKTLLPKKTLEYLLR